MNDGILTIEILRIELGPAVEVFYAELERVLREQARFAAVLVDDAETALFYLRRGAFTAAVADAGFCAMHPAVFDAALASVSEGIFSLLIIVGGLEDSFRRGRVGRSGGILFSVPEFFAAEDVEAIAAEILAVLAAGAPGGGETVRDALVFAA